MDEKIMANIQSNRNEVCIQTDKIYDSCRDKECIEDIRVFFCERAQDLIDQAINVKCRKSEVIWVFVDVEPLPFNTGFFTVDIKFFFRITLDVFTGISRPTTVEGLATFDKKVVLFGSEGNAKIFQSTFKEDTFDPQLWKKTNMPKAVVEVVDPICLNARIVDARDRVCSTDNEIDIASIPECVQRVFDDVIVNTNSSRRVLVSLGLFSIIKLQRNVQLLIPSHDFCVPENECVAATEDNPCDLFDRLEFPVSEFFPPQREDFQGSVFNNKDRRKC